MKKEDFEALIEAVKKLETEGRGRQSIFIAHQCLVDSDLTQARVALQCIEPVYYDTFLLKHLDDDEFQECVIELMTIFGIDLKLVHPKGNA